MNQEQKIARLRLVADGLRRIQEFESARYLDEYAAALKAAQGGVTEAMYRGALQAWIDRAELDFPARLLAALEAALSAEPAAPCSLNEAMEVMEVWADHGGQVHGEAAARLRALADRIAPEPAAQPEDSRCPPTYRREEAVKALIGMGWTWDGKAWAEPAAQGEAGPVVAWMTKAGRVINTETRERVLADAELGGEYIAAAKAAEAYCIPLYTAPPAEPAAQGEEGFDARKYVLHMADVLEAGGDLFKVDADLLRLAAAINKAANTAPPAQLAERVPEARTWITAHSDTRKAIAGLLRDEAHEREQADDSTGIFADLAGATLLAAIADALEEDTLWATATPAAPADGDGKEGSRD